MHEPDGTRPLQVRVVAERRRSGGLHESDKPQPRRVQVAANKIAKIFWN